MRAVGIGFAIALALGVSAHADDEFDSLQAWTRPKAEQLRERWPRDANGDLIYGQVALQCGVGRDGFATDCKVKSSKPKDERLETSALAVAPLYKANAKNRSGATLFISVMADTPPDWLKKPSFEQMMLVWPRSEASAGSSGTAAVRCVVNKQGLTQDCSVIYENPVGHGWGEAALKLTPTLLMKPATRKGEPVEQEVVLPFLFAGSQGFHLPNAVVVGMPRWSKAPTASEILGQLGSKVGDKFADGKVVFMCDLNKSTGKVGYCIVANASAGMAEFTEVGKALADKFQADAKSIADLQAWLGPTKTEALVFVPFSFPDMTSPAWTNRYVTHVQWESTPGRDARRALFPQQALKAGLNAGSATVDCAIGADGTLSQCQVLNESAPGVGFGEAATKIAESSVANRWTEEGLPVEGARLQWAIEMTYDDKIAAAPAPTPATKP